jgi:parallel beta-helix repeat protein
VILISHTHRRERSALSRGQGDFLDSSPGSPFLVAVILVAAMPLFLTLSATSAHASSGIAHSSNVSRCSGVPVRPGTHLQAKIDANPQGTTFCLREGVHDLPIGGVLVKSFDRIVGEPGAVLDGRGIATRGLYGFGGKTGQKNVLIRRLVIRNVAGQAIKAGWNWVIKRNRIGNSTVGVALNQGIVLRGNRIHHNAQYGIFGGPTSDVLIVRNELDHNNTSNSCGGACSGDAGGSKIVGSTPGTYGVVWQGNWVHDNTGNGIWSDGNVHSVLYVDNLVEGNSGSGIFHEISWDATIRNNIVHGNATETAGKSCWWGAQIHVNNSQGVRIVGNRVRSAAGANGICLVDATRPQTSPFSTKLANVEVRDNVIRLQVSAMAGLVGSAARNITFDANTYFVPSLTGKFWAWYDRYPLTWREFRERGQEQAGRRR